MRAILKTVAAAFAAVLAATSAFAQQKTQLTVYSTLVPEHIAEFKKAFEAENPDVEIIWIRELTGVVAARIIAARRAPAGRCHLGARGHVPSLI